MIFKEKLTFVAFKNLKEYAKMIGEI